MGMITDLGIVGITGSVIGRLMADELKAWIPRMQERLICCAVRKLPADRRERFSEEWRSHIEETPGDLSKLLTAVGYMFASWKISYDCERGRRARQGGLEEPIWMSRLFDRIAHQTSRLAVRVMLTEFRWHASKRVGGALCAKFVPLVKPRLTEIIREDFREALRRGYRNGARLGEIHLLENPLQVAIEQVLAELEHSANRFQALANCRQD